MRKIIQCPAPREKVFDFLAKGADTGLAVHAKDRDSFRVALRSGVSLFSWGEEVEATVVSEKEGCRVVLEGRSLHPFNPTADVEGRVEEVARSLKREFGEKF